MDMAVLDNPVWHSLAGDHASLARHSGDALWYGASYAPFIAVSSADAHVDDDPRLEGRRYFLGVAPRRMPVAWRRSPVLAGQAGEATLQLVRGIDAPPVTTKEVVTLLGPEHRERMRALAALVYPEFFRDHTLALGQYVGVLRDSRLVAMAGERMTVPGAREISAVCTHPEFLGHGLGRACLVDLVSRHRDRGLASFLHVSAGNDGATRLYEKLDFVHRATLKLTAIDIQRAPISP